MTNLATLSRANASRWAHARLIRGPEFAGAARRLIAGKARFQAMAARTRVPWFVIAVIKEREAGADAAWVCNIANGQRWDRKTSIVPIGRGPFKSWDDAAIDALVNCAPYASRWTDWSGGGALTLLEQYNGLGYALKSVPSPYIWSGTDQYVSGKYVADHVYSASAVDRQLGCAGILMAMQAIDPSIAFGVAPSTSPVVGVTKLTVVPSHTTASTPSISHPALGSVGAKLAGWLASIFKKTA